jgi:hypothetical protein
MKLVFFFTSLHETHKMNEQCPAYPIIQSISLFSLSKIFRKFWTDTQPAAKSPGVWLTSFRCNFYLEKTLNLLSQLRGLLIFTYDAKKKVPCYDNGIKLVPDGVRHDSFHFYWHIPEKLSLLYGI